MKYSPYEAKVKNFVSNESQAWMLESGLKVGSELRRVLNAQSLIPFESVDDQWDLRVQERKPSDTASQMLTADPIQNPLDY